MAGLYYGVTISLVSFATGLSVVTLNIHHRGMRGRGVPPLVKKIVFGVMAKVLFIHLDIPEGCACTKTKVRIRQRVDFADHLINLKSMQECHNNQFEMNERDQWRDTSSVRFLIGRSNTSFS